MRYADPRMRLLHNVAVGKYQKGHAVSIAVDDIVIPSECPVLGIPLFFTPGKCTWNTPTIDRFDNSKGYTQENIRVISWRANYLKRDMDVETITRLYRYMTDKD